jgi:predicted SAM-dependent methyltransferase
LYLNLACGTDIKDGWQNLDVVSKWPLSRRACDVIWDARKDKIPFPDNSAEQIYAGSLILHLAPCWHASVLAEIHRVLSPQGFVTFDEVDMDVVLRRYLADPLDFGNNQLIWGEQGTVHGEDLVEFDKHCWGFTEASLRKTLESAGFKIDARIQVHQVYYDLALRCSKGA